MVFGNAASFIPVSCRLVDLKYLADAADLLRLCQRQHQQDPGFLRIQRITGEHIGGNIPMERDNAVMDAGCDDDRFPGGFQVPQLLFPQQAHFSVASPCNDQPVGLLILETQDLGICVNMEIGDGDLREGYEVIDGKPGMDGVLLDRSIVKVGLCVPDIAEAAEII